MKVRNGFVSNSSSTSFCIYGAHLDSDIIRNNYAMTDEENLYDVVYEKLEGEEGFETHFDPWGGGVYVGVSFTDIQDAETGAEFKERVKNQFIKAGFDVKLSAIQESWYDG